METWRQRGYTLAVLDVSVLSPNEYMSLLASGEVRDIRVGDLPLTLRLVEVEEGGAVSTYHILVVEGMQVVTIYNADRLTRGEAAALIERGGMAIMEDETSIVSILAPVTLEEASRQRVKPLVYQVGDLLRPVATYEVGKIIDRVAQRDGWR